MNQLYRIKSALGLAWHAPRLRDAYERERDTVDKWDAYIDVYDSLFRHLTKQPIQLLEIGVMRGGSLNMWRRYFHPDSVIVGLDIDQRCKSIEGGNVKIEIGDQESLAVTSGLKERYGFFDIVIDDGGHFWNQQISTFKELYDMTRSLYVVEDTHTSYWEKYGSPNSPTFIDFSRQQIDLLHEYFIHAGSPDEFGPPAPRYPDVSRFRQMTTSIEFFDSMVVFKKGENPAPFRSRLLRR
jgi:hypothetical protein